ncbi:MAG: ABC transporter ATP-binding protein [Lachnospiraceae bacterium]|nr:ABC transporter ATP-binding protein [Lachnospiraceae bacterium]
MKENIMLSVKNLSIQFGGLHAVENFNLSIRENELYGLIGPNGAGKTTIFNLLTGVYKPTSGTILLNGVNKINGKNTIEINKMGIARTFQNIRLFHKLTVHDNVKIALQNKYRYSTISGILRLPRYHRYEALMDEEAMALLKVFNLENDAMMKSANLPYGKQRKLEIARAIATNPKVLLLDEPLGALDLKLRKEMQTELKNIQQQLEITFVYVTHDQEEALTMSDVVVVMNNGQIQQIGSPIDIYNEPQNAFVADFIGESNIISGIMYKDYMVGFLGHDFICVDKGFACNEEVDVVIRPEDVKLLEVGNGRLEGVVESIIFKGVHYEMKVDSAGYSWIVHSTLPKDIGSLVGIDIDPNDIHIMKKMEI